MNEKAVVYSKREYLKSVDFDTRTITIRPTKPKKITGTKLNAALGKSQYKSPFAVACDLTRLYTLVEETKYTNAGHVIEPKIRDHVRSIVDEVAKMLCANGKMGVEEPVPAEICYYDHFKNTPTFGGMVDGYITCDGERCAVLEIKTSSHPEQWQDEKGEYTKVPDDYMVQASLYCELAKLDKIVFAVGFLTDEDYDIPENWKITEDNFRIVIATKKDISKELGDAKVWIDNIIETCTLPPWTDDDLEIVEYLTTKHLRMVSVKLEKTISEFVRSGLKDEFLPEIKSQLVGYYDGSDRKMVYEQDGYEFILIRDDDSVEMTVQPKP